MIIRATYVSGVFRPTEPVSLPEGTEVEIRVIEQSPLPDVDPEALRAIYPTLSARYTSGRSDIAERHNEHRP